MLLLYLQEDILKWIQLWCLADFRLITYGCACLEQVPCRGRDEVPEPEAVNQFVYEVRSTGDAP